MNRVRKRYLPDWRSQSSFRYREYNDPTRNDGTNPVLSLEAPTNNSEAWYTYPRGLQITVDENHNISRFKNRRLSVDIDGDVGGDFRSTKKYVMFDGFPVRHHIDWSGKNSGAWRRLLYDGPVFPVGIDASQTSVTFSDNDLTTAGATAIARCKPTNNVADLGTAFTEIFRDGLPKLFGAHTWENRTNVARSAGDEYLNAQFGWLPLVNDIRNASYGLANAHRLYSSYERNSGKVVRRRYEFPVERTEVTQAMTPVDCSDFMQSSYPARLDLTKPTPLLFKTTRTYKRTWFSGAFTYHLPSNYFSRSWLGEKASELGYLFGLELTPDVVWNAAPWTWAIDWFSNMGDVASNLSDWSTDGLVMKYGYIMEHRFMSVTYYNTTPSRYRPYGAVWSSPLTAYYETKRRQKASPFGFGLTWNGLSPRQLAIAAALGITRVF